MVTLLLSALMAASPMNDTVARYDSGKTLEEIAEESPWKNMAPMPHFIRTEPDTIGYWLDRSIEPCVSMVHPMVPRCAHEQREIIDTTWVIRKRPNDGGK